MQVSNGNILVGGKDGILYEYSENFILLRKVDLGGELIRGVEIMDTLYLNIGNSKQLQIYDGVIL